MIMNKTLIKSLLVLLLLGAGTLIYVYAQRGYLFRNSGKKIENKVLVEEPADDIGTLTDDNPWKEMAKLVQAYYNKHGVSYKGLIKLIDDNNEKEKVIEEQNFEYSVIEQNMYYRLGSTEFVSKNDLVLVADHLNKIISVSRVIHTEDQAKKLFDINEFKKIMEETKAKAKVTQLGNEKILTIENITDPQIQGYRIYYDPKTFRISKMLIGMLRLSPIAEDESGIDKIPGSAEDKISDEKTGETTEGEIETYTYFLEIIYNEMKPLDLTEKTFNPESKFIIKTGNRIELRPAFSKYQLINNGNSERETEENIEKEK